ncbi:Chromosome transmission fidelity protein 18 [Neocucurbitaria cava]|uniref:Chromosome transmission fidelity protein 18 n=1 Tax=Neocucurbitaria cava TaxID=798079 RepID=A0A9W8Y0D3_9PLEO|nr:Chromosome transmission fidelity protein 18 [Neocucurbitaria cava]
MGAHVESDIEKASSQGEYHIRMLEESGQTLSSNTSFRSNAHHDDSHAGPYGVEMPSDWAFVVTVTEVNAAVKADVEREMRDKKEKDVKGS